MVTFKIGTCSDEKNRIDKSYSFAHTLSGTLKDNTSVTDPVITVESSANLSGCNYAEIEEFGRLYFITDIVVKGALLWEIHLHVDVLTTYKNGIISAPAIIAKSSNTFNMYLNDPSYKCYQDNYVFYRAFPSGFPIQDSHFVLTVIGDREVEE